jgi:DNA-binding transcriptional LysR family regulator
MSRMHEDLDVALRLLKRVSAPNHSFRSWGQLEKRERLPEDKATRVMARCADLAGGDLAQVQDNRIVPTALGCQFRDLVERLLDLSKSQAEPVEIVRVGIAPGIDASLLAPAIARFTAQWGGVVALQAILVPDGMRDAVRSGAIGFGVGWPDTDSLGADERLEPPIPVSILVPDGHRLAGEGGPIDADHLRPSDRAHFSPRLTVPLRDLLARVPPAHRSEVGCSETLHQLAAVGAGLGFEYAHSVRRTLDSFARLPVTGVEPASLGLWLPRDPERMTEPAKFLATAIRQAVREAAELALPLPELPDLGIPLPEPLPA